MYVFQNKYNHNHLLDVHIYKPDSIDQTGS